MPTLRLGTRSSALARAQCESVAAALRGHGYEVELVAVDSSGGASPASGGDKARFVHGVEQALREEAADIGVHSAKDLPSESEPGLEIAAVPAREDPRDVWIDRAGTDGTGGPDASEDDGQSGAPHRSDAAHQSGTSRGSETPRQPGTLTSVPAQARVGTSSLRRRSQLLSIRPDLDVVELRGNVDTRLQRLASGDYDAIILAEAGLRRLGRTDARGFAIPAAELLPAAGQGALVLQTRSGDGASRKAAEEIGDRPSLVELLCERALIEALAADCDSPVGARCAHAGSELLLEAYAGDAGGEDRVSDRLAGAPDDPVGLGARVGERMLSAGAGDILGHR